MGVQALFVLGVHMYASIHDADVPSCGCWPSVRLPLLVLTMCTSTDSGGLPLQGHLSRGILPLWAAPPCCWCCEVLPSCALRTRTAHRTDREERHYNLHATAPLVHDMKNSS